MGVLRSYPSSNVSTMSHRVSQTRCQSASLPHHPAAGGFVDEEKTERGRTVGWEDGSECISFPPLSSTSTLSRGVTSYLRPGAVSLAAAMARGALSLSLSLALSRLAGQQRGLGCVEHWSVLTWEPARVGDGQRPTESKRRRELRPFSHVFDMGLVPTGVKEGRAE